MENHPVAWVACVHTSPGERPDADSIMKSGQIVPVYDLGDGGYLNNCLYHRRLGVIMIDDSPGDNNWPSIQPVIDGDEECGWGGVRYRAFSTQQKAQDWVAERLEEKPT